MRIITRSCGITGPCQVCGANELELCLRAKDVVVTAKCSPLGHLDITPKAPSCETQLSNAEINLQHSAGDVENLRHEITNLKVELDTLRTTAQHKIDTLNNDLYVERKRIEYVQECLHESQEKSKSCRQELDAEVAARQRQHVELVAAREAAQEMLAHLRDINDIIKRGLNS